MPQLTTYTIISTEHTTQDKGCSQMGLTQSNICTYCKDNSVESYMHAIWFCMPVQQFLQKICDDLTTWFGCYISTSLCNIVNISELDMEANASCILLTSLCITKKSLMLMCSI